jgi:hypothetical protein
VSGRFIDLCPPFFDIDNDITIPLAILTSAMKVEESGQAMVDAMVLKS